jgi:hypothetical protein
MMQANFGLNWPSGFRDEYSLKNLQTDDEWRTDDGRQVMAIAHTGELKNIVQFMKG